MTVCMPRATAWPRPVCSGLSSSGCVRMYVACRAVKGSIWRSVSRRTPLQPGRRFAPACTSCAARSDHVTAQRLAAALPQHSCFTGASSCAAARAPRARAWPLAVASIATEMASRRPQLILGIESSCDDTGAAVVSSDGRILGEAIASQACDAEFKRLRAWLYWLLGSVLDMGHCQAARLWSVARPRRARQQPSFIAKPARQ